MTIRSHPSVRVHHEEWIHRGSRISLVRQDLELPSGLRFQVDLVQHPGAVAVAAFDRGGPDGAGRLLVVRQYRPSLGEWIYELPAGALEAGEDPREAAGREFEEETGLRAPHLEHWESIYPAPGFTSEVVHIYHAPSFEAPEDAAGCDEDEELEVHWLTQDELLETSYHDGKTWTALLLGMRRGLL